MRVLGVGCKGVGFEGWGVYYFSVWGLVLCSALDMVLGEGLLGSRVQGPGSRVKVSGFRV